MKRFLLLSLCLAVVPPMIGAGFIEKLTPEKRRAAGLEKLTSEERAELEALIEAHHRGELAQVRKEVEEVRKEAEKQVADATTSKRPAWISALITLKAAESDNEAEAVASRLVGEYKGWSGRTTFKLENGQIWQQVDGASRVDSPRASPAVKVYPGMLGVYWLEVDGVRQRVKVKPIRLE